MDSSLHRDTRRQSIQIQQQIPFKIPQTETRGRMERRLPRRIDLLQITPSAPQVPLAGRVLLHVGVLCSEIRGDLI